MSALDFYRAWQQQRPVQPDINLAAVLIDQAQRERLRQQALADEARQVFQRQQFQHNENQLARQAELERSKFLQDSYLNRLRATEQARDHDALVKSYRSLGIVPNNGESDADFEKRAQAEYKQRSEKEIGSLRNHINFLENRKITLAQEAEQKRANEIEQMARVQVAANLGLKPNEMQLVQQLGPINAAASLNKPEIATEYTKEKLGLMKSFPYPDSIRAELGAIEDELRASRGVYDDTVKNYRALGGGLSALFPEDKTAPAKSSALPLPPLPKESSTKPESQSPGANLGAAAPVDTKGLIPGAISKAAGVLGNIVESAQPIRNAAHDAGVFLFGGNYAPPAPAPAQQVAPPSPAFFGANGLFAAQPQQPVAVPVPVPVTPPEFQRPVALPPERMIQGYYTTPQFPFQILNNPQPQPYTGPVFRSQ